MPTFRIIPGETFGAWDPTAVDTLSRLARDAAAEKNEDVPRTVKFFFQRLSLNLMRGNAALLLSRRPSLPSDNVFGNIHIDNPDY